MVDTTNNIHKQSEPSFSVSLYRWRWLLSIIFLALVIGVFVSGIRFVGDQTSSVLQMGDISDGRGAIEPQMFDPSLDVWFTGSNDTVDTYHAIEDRFIAEDFVMVSFEEIDSQYGVFDQNALATISRLTNEFLKIPGVRHVRSLTHNPWIRWGDIPDSSGSEEGLIVTDLVEDTTALTHDDVVERMVAVLGADTVESRLGEGAVFDALGADTALNNYIGEPMLLGTLVNDAGTATALQIQLLRPHLTDESIASNGPLASSLYSVQAQRAALRAIELIVKREMGLILPTVEYLSLSEQVDLMSAGPEKSKLVRELNDPRKPFVTLSDGQVIQKYHDYEQMDDGSWADANNPEDFAQTIQFEPESLSSYEFHLAGVPIFERNFEITGKADAALLPLSWLVIFIGLLVLLRSFTGAIVPMIVVIVSVLGTVGAVFYSGHLFNNLTAMLPNMLTVIGVADSVHLVSAYLLLRPSHTDKETLIVEVIKRNAIPVFLTSITTAVGFLSLVLIDLAPVKQLALSMAVGSILAYLVSMTLVPSLLSLLPVSSRVKPRWSSVGLFSPRRADALAAWVFQHKKSIVLSAMVLTLITLLGASRIQINADPRTMFPDDNQVLMNMEWIEDRLGGVGDLEIVFSTSAAVEKIKLNNEELSELEQLKIAKAGADDNFPEFTPLSTDDMKRLSTLEEKENRLLAAQIGLSGSFLEQLDQFEARLREEMDQPDSPLKFLTDLNSPLDILRKMHQVQNRNEASFYRVPSDEDVHPDVVESRLEFDEVEQEWWLTPAQTVSTLVSQYYLQYENGARPGENLASQLSPDRHYFRMQGRLGMGSSNEREQTYARIIEIAESEFPTLAGQGEALSTMSVSGKTMLVDATGSVIAIGYTKSLMVALLVIALFIGLVFRSPRFAVLSLLPNVFPILVPIGILGAMGIALDGPAIVACSIALGLCVDDTIHLFSKFRDAERLGLIGEKAIAYAFRECGNALTVTTIVLVFGFLTVATGDFSPNVYIGLLGTIMIMVAYVADFLVTPAVLAYSHQLDLFKPKTIHQDAFV